MDNSELPPEKPSYKITERQYENYTKTGCSDFEAFKHFDIKSWDEVEPSETTKSEEIIESGVSVNLADAESKPYLKDALKKYLNASELNSFACKKESEDYLDEASQLSKIANRRRREGDIELSKVFGFEVMKSAGYDPEELKFEAREAAHEFYERYTGADNKKRRTKFLRVLEKEKKNK